MHTCKPAACILVPLKMAPRVMISPLVLQQETLLGPPLLQGPELAALICSTLSGALLPSPLLPVRCMGGRVHVDVFTTMPASGGILRASIYKHYERAAWVSRESTELQGGGGNFAPSQIRGGKFRCGKFRGAPWVEWITPHQSPQCVPLVWEIFAENPEFRVENFGVNLKRESSHANLKCHEPPPPLCMRV